MIKHIVISGGATSGVSMIGILKKLNDNKFYDIKNIETLWGTSVGSMISVLLALDINWDSIYTYVTDRPWDKILTVHPTDVIESYTSKGLYCSYDLIRKFFIPLFKTKDINIDITMKQYYQLTNIHISIFTVSVNNVECMEISHKTHPDMEVIRALSMSCAIPVIFKPVLYKGDYYCDGGIINNFPVMNCIEYVKDQQSETKEDYHNIILGIIHSKFINKDVTLDEDDTIFKYMYSLLYKFVTKIKIDYYREIEMVKTTFPYIISFAHDVSDVERFKNIIYKNERLDLLKRGESIATEFLQNEDSAEDSIV